MRSPCVLWPGRLDPDGYGRISNKASEMAHREVYACAVGPIPEGWEVDHLCRVRACVNPEHLEAVTVAENRKRQGEAMTHCRNGHEFTLRNTAIRKGTTHRVCRRCNANAQRRSQERKVAA